MLTEWQALLKPEIQAFIQKNEAADTSLLLLQKHKFSPDFPLSAVAEQIEARRKAQRKLPTWHKKPLILFSQLALEQCSSEETAAFKAKLFGKAQSLIDLSGGFGVDTAAFAAQIRKVTHVEPNRELQLLVQHNFTQLSIENVNYLNKTALEALAQLSVKPDLAYLDPSRRKAEKKVFLLEDCEPSVRQVWQKLQTISPETALLVKLSPLLDITALRQSLPDTQKIWVIAVQNEVKEILLYLKKATSPDSPPIEAINLLTNENIARFSFTLEEEQNALVKYTLPQKFLYEPNAAILKAGAFSRFAEYYNLAKLHQHSHLYTSDVLIDCPARRFEVLAICPYQAKAVAKYLPDKKANISKRNFPESVATIRKKLKLKEGGNHYLFASTLANNKRALLICQKV